MENIKPKGKGLFSKIIQIVAAIVVITLLTAGVSFFVVKNVVGPGINKDVEPSKTSVTYPAGDYLTNLSDKGYIKFSMVYLLSDKEVENEIDQKDSEIRDKILTILRAKKFTEVKDSHGMDVLRDDIRDGINGILKTGEVQDIYFTSIIVN